MQLEAGGIRRAIAFPIASDPSDREQSSRRRRPHFSFARNPIVSRQGSGRVLSLWDQPTSQLCSGDQPQLREEAVLAADEQAGASGLAAFGRQTARAALGAATMKAIAEHKADGTQVLT